MAGFGNRNGPPRNVAWAARKARTAAAVGGVKRFRQARLGGLVRRRGRLEMKKGNRRMPIAFVPM